MMHTHRRRNTDVRLTKSYALPDVFDDFFGQDRVPISTTF